MLTDTHCHLDELVEPAGILPDGIVRRAAEAGVTRVIAVSQDRASMQQVLELRRRYPALVLAGLGLHPMQAARMTDAEVDVALQFLAAHVAEADVVGEVGLDYKHARTPEEQTRQLDVLRRQLALAAAAGRPINLHSRGARPDALDAARKVLEIALEFRPAHGLGVQLHWFTHSVDLIRQSNEAGIHVSVGPSLLDSSTQRQAAQAVARDLLLIETGPRQIRPSRRCGAGMGPPGGRGHRRSAMGLPDRRGGAADRDELLRLLSVRPSIRLERPIASG